MSLILVLRTGIQLHSGFSWLRPGLMLRLQEISPWLLCGRRSTTHGRTIYVIGIIFRLLLVICQSLSGLASLSSAWSLVISSWILTLLEPVLVISCSWLISLNIFRLAGCLCAGVTGCRKSIP